MSPLFTTLGISYPATTDGVALRADLAQQAATTDAAIAAAKAGAISAASFVQRDLVNGENFGALYTAGVYRAAGATGFTDTPPFDTPQDPWSGFVLVENVGAGTWAAQTVTRYGIAPERWWRVSQTTGGVWGAWQRVPVDSDATVGAANARLVEDWSRRRGGVKSTGGKGAVALRFDHGLTTMKSTIVPLLAARNLPFAVAMNPSNWALAENSGATQADVQGWVTSDGCEIWNHGGNHG